MSGGSSEAIFLEGPCKEFARRSPYMGAAMCSSLIQGRLRGRVGDLLTGRTAPLRCLDLLCRVPECRARPSSLPHPRIIVVIFVSRPLLRSHSQRANPADTPIELVVKFELVINLKAARVFLA